MEKYINAAEAAEKVAAATGINIADIVDVFAEIPAADVAPVVHCKDCEYSYEDIAGLMRCYKGCKGNADRIVREDFFCADGAKREAADD